MQRYATALRHIYLLGEWKKVVGKYLRFIYGRLNDTVYRTYTYTAVIVSKMKRAAAYLARSRSSTTTALSRTDVLSGVHFFNVRKENLISPAYLLSVLRPVRV